MGTSWKLAKLAIADEPLDAVFLNPRGLVPNYPVPHSNAALGDVSL